MPLTVDVLVGTKRCSAAHSYARTSTIQQQATRPWDTGITRLDQSVLHLISIRPAIEFISNVQHSVAQRTIAQSVKKGAAFLH